MERLWIPWFALPCMKSALAEWNCDFPEALFYVWGGLPVAKIISLLNEKQGLDMPAEKVARKKEELYLSLFRISRPSLKCWSTSICNMAGFLCRGVRKHARLGDRFAPLLAATGEV